MKFERPEQLTLMGLVAAAVDDDAARFALSDFIDAAAFSLAMKLRLTPRLSYLWECAAFAGKEGVKCRRLCVRAVREMGAQVRFHRATRRDFAPEVEPGTGRDPVPTLREAEGDARYKQRLNWMSYRLRVQTLCSLAHCTRLSMRALSGEDVPPDVCRLACAFAEVIRSQLRHLRVVVERLVSE